MVRSMRCSCCTLASSAFIRTADHPHGTTPNHSEEEENKQHRAWRTGTRPCASIGLHVTLPQVFSPICRHCNPKQRLGSAIYDALHQFANTREPWMHIEQKKPVTCPRSCTSFRFYDALRLLSTSCPPKHCSSLVVLFYKPSFQHRHQYLLTSSHRLSQHIRITFDTLLTAKNTRR